MSADVCIIFPRLDPSAVHHYMPYSSLAVAGVLRAAGIGCTIFDERVHPLEKLDAMLRGAGAACLTVFAGHQTHAAYRLLKRIKTRFPHVPTVVGGPMAKEIPHVIAADEHVDHVYSGFAESSLAELLRAVLDGKPTTGIPHAHSKAWPAMATSLPNRRKQPLHFQRIPFDMVDMPLYVNPETRRAMYLTQYGCPGMCTFCSTDHTRLLLERPLDILKDDLQALHDSGLFRQLIIYDSAFFVRKERAWQVMASLDTFEFQWFSNGRADQLIHYGEDEFRRIKDIAGGCLGIGVGLESGSKHVAETLMRKGKNHLEVFRQAARLLAQADIPLTSGVVFGAPGETPRDVRESRDYISSIRDIHPDFIIQTGFLVPYVNTPLTLLLTKQGFVKDMTFAEHAEAGAGDAYHVKFNRWTRLPWMPEDSIEEYRKEYDSFMKTHGDILR